MELDTLGQASFLSEVVRKASAGFNLIVLEIAGCRHFLKSKCTSLMSLKLQILKISEKRFKI